MAKLLRLALGACIIQSEYGFSDEETALQIQEGPYLQFFCDFPQYEYKQPFPVADGIFSQTFDAMLRREIFQNNLSLFSDRFNTLDKLDRNGHYISTVHKFMPDLKIRYLDCDRKTGCILSTSPKNSKTYLIEPST